MSLQPLHCVWQSRTLPLNGACESEQVAALRVAYDFMLGFVDDDEDMQPGIAAKVAQIRAALVNAGVCPDVA